MNEEIGSTLTPEEVERNKDLMDLKPNLQYVERFIERYRQALSHLLATPVAERAQQRVDSVIVSNVVRDSTLQLSPEKALEVLAHLPPEILKISGLKELNYEYQRFIPIPDFTDDGFFGGCSGMVSADTFPIEQKDDGTEIQHHPSRILIGNNYKGVIRPSFLPATVSTSKEAVEIYQIHVLLHEFFHTIEEQFRTDENAEKLRIIFQDGTVKTFRQWREEFINSMIKSEPVYSSNYAKTYSDKIVPGVDLNSYAVAEQLCESFVAYILGRAPNDAGYEDFESFDFGNLHPEIQLVKGYGSIRHELIDEFFNAKFITKS